MTRLAVTTDVNTLGSSGTTFLKLALDRNDCDIRIVQTLLAAGTKSQELKQGRIQRDIRLERPRLHMGRPPISPASWRTEQHMSSTLAQPNSSAVPSFVGRFRRISASLFARALHRARARRLLRLEADVSVIMGI